MRDKSEAKSESDQALLRQRPLGVELARLDVLGRDLVELGDAETSQLLVGHLLSEDQAFDLAGAAFELPSGPDFGLGVGAEGDFLEIPGHRVPPTRADSSIAADEPAVAC